MPRGRPQKCTRNVELPVSKHQKPGQTPMRPSHDLARCLSERSSVIPSSSHPRHLLPRPPRRHFYPNPSQSSVPIALTPLIRAHPTRPSAKTIPAAPPPPGLYKLNPNSRDYLTGQSCWNWELALAPTWFPHGLGTQRGTWPVGSRGA